MEGEGYEPSESQFTIYRLEGIAAFSRPEFACITCDISKPVIRANTWLGDITHLIKKKNITDKIIR